MPAELLPPLESCPTCGTDIDVTDIEPLTPVQCPACGAEFLCGQTFGDYDLIEVMGRGGMGVVYRALDRSLARSVALKLLRREQGQEGLISKLESEAAITASINHPHVVKVFTTGTVQGRFYLAMELVDKGTLDDLIELQGRIAEAQALEIAIQAAQGLRAANQHGLIHRDIKPGNILFADAHTSKIVDFGLAIMEEAAKGTDEIWGTPYYVSPERLDQKPEDFRSDIYSLGATIFHAIAGRPPFEAADATMVALKHLKSQAVSLQAFAPWVSGSTAFVINRMLAKDPAARYASYDELLEHLEYAREEVISGNAKPAEKKRVILETDEDRQRWGYLTIAMILIVLVLGIGGGAYLMFGPKPKPTGPPEVMSVGAEGKYSAPYENARHFLLQDKPAEAAGLFMELGTQHGAPEPLAQWCLLQSGLAQLVAGNLPNAQAAFTQLGAKPYRGEESAALGQFFHRMAMLGETPDPIDPDSLKETNLHNYDALGLLIAGLKDWELGDFEHGVNMLRRFQSTDASGKFAWVTEYRELAGDYLSDFSDYHGAMLLSKEAHSEHELQNAAETLRKVKAGLKRSGALSTKLEQAAVAALEKIKQEATELDARKKALEGLRDQLATLCREGKYQEARAAVRSVEAPTAEMQAEQRLMQEKVDWLAAIGAKAGENPVEVLKTAEARILPETPPQSAAEQRWRAGVYAVFTGQREKARELLEAAARGDARWADALPMLLPPHYVNLAKGKPATSSEAMPKPGAGPEKAVDGDGATRWEAATPGDKWLRVDLGQPMTMVRYVIKHAGTHGGPKESNSVDYALQCSDNDRDWRNVEALKNKSSALTDHRVHSFTARYVRLLITKAGASENAPAQIYELELYGNDDHAEPVDNLFRAAMPSLVPDLTGTDIGLQPNEGSGSTSVDEKTGVITLRGGGVDIYRNADGFRFLHRPWKGDGTWIVKLLSVEHTHEHSKAGLMLRDGLSPEARMVFIGGVPTPGAVWEVRNAAKAATVEKRDLDFNAPFWVKLVRAGNTFSAFASRDGEEWKPIASETVQMSAEVEAGLAVTSHDTTKQAAVKAEFRVFGK